MPLAPVSRRTQLRQAVLICIATTVAPCNVAMAALLQQGGGATLPVEVTAAPSKSLQGGRIKLSGKTGLTGASSKVTLRVKPPGTTPPVVLALKVASDGSFTSVFLNTSQLGVYQVQAIAPDGKGQANTSFRIVAAEVIPTEIGRSVDSLVLIATQALKVARQGVDALPGSPERAEAQKRLSEIDVRMAKLPAQTAVLTQQMQKVFKARAQLPMDNPQWDVYVEKLDEWQADASRRGTAIRGRIKAASAQTQLCGRLDTCNEMLTAASEVMSLVTAPFDFSKSFWIDKLPPAFVARSGAGEVSPEKKFVAVQTMKLGAAALEGPAGMVSAVPGFVIDLAGFVVQQEFSKYCQKFEGPISAAFLGESFTKTGEPFSNYTIRLDGKLVLMYDKSAPSNKPIGVIGYMEGNGQFTVRDNPKPIIRLTPGVVLFHKVISPPGSGYFDEIGQGTRGFFPHSFRIPVKGTLYGDSIIIALQPAVNDFSSVIQGRSIYVVMPTGGLVPQIIDSKFPLQKAFPILDRVIRPHPVLHVSYVGGTRAEGTFARDTTNAEKTARVRTKLTIKACNPGCVKLPLSPPAGKK
jgi:hypothetical protein